MHTKEDDVNGQQEKTTAERGDLDRLIGALRDEGVEKGRREAERIVEEAKRQAAGIVEEARTESEALVAEAHRKAKETNDRLEQQLTLALRDFLLKAKAQLEELIAIKPLREKAKEAFADPQFMKKLIAEIVQAYLKRADAPQSHQIQITIPKEMREEFVTEWIKLMRDELHLHAGLHTERGLHGFKLSAEGAGGELVVDDESIIELLRPFISERFHYLLNEGKLPKD